MGLVTEKDFRKVMDGLQEIYSCRNPDDFPRDLTAALMRCISADMGAYIEIDNAKIKYFTNPTDAVPSKYLAIHNALEHEYPFNRCLLARGVKNTHPFKDDLERFAQRQREAGVDIVKRPVKTSSILSRRQWHRLTLYNEVYRKVGLEDDLCLALAVNEHGATRGVTLMRGMSFTQKDWAIMDMLSPHILHAYRNAEAAAHALVEAALLRQAVEETGAAIIGLDRDCNARQITKNAWELTKKYFPATPFDGCRLPEQLREWAARQQSLLKQTDTAPKPLVPLLIRKEKTRLCVRFMQGTEGNAPLLLIKEEPVVPPPEKSLETFGLTPKETEALLLLAQGKTNPVIARILGISEKTVKNHLNSIFAKLGVDNRTSAALMAVEELKIKS